MLIFVLNVCLFQMYVFFCEGTQILVFYSINNSDFDSFNKFFNFSNSLFFQYKLCDYNKVRLKIQISLFYIL